MTGRNNLLDIIPKAIQDIDCSDSYWLLIRNYSTIYNFLKIQYKTSISSILILV